MNKDYSIYVTTQIALKALEKGYPLMRLCGMGPIETDIEPPTAEQICNWLRSEHKLFVHCDYRNQEYNGVTKKFSFTHFYYIINGKVRREYEGYFLTYKKALLEGINAALDLI